MCIAPGGAVHRLLGPQSRFARRRVRTLACSSLLRCLGGVSQLGVTCNRTLNVFPMLQRVLLAPVKREL